MDNFDPKRMSKITYPCGVNETEYLRLVEDGKWIASDKEQICVLYNYDLAKSVAALNAQLHPINSTDRDAMIVSLKKEIELCQEFLNKYVSWPAWKSSIEVKDARRGIKHMEKEIARLKKMDFTGGA